MQACIVTGCILVATSLGGVWRALTCPESRLTPGAGLELTAAIVELTAAMVQTNSQSVSKASRSCGDSGSSSSSRAGPKATKKAKAQRAQRSAALCQAATESACSFAQGAVFNTGMEVLDGACELLRPQHSHGNTADALQDGVPLPVLQLLAGFPCSI